ncbi:uncharacterized protein LOC116346167 [Contarinia nasturtii]|uniref:uncharacterized protein LOC116346167 n=1 Tax=Contarinia nasturtii TaxID=265458 RepID=UPI0012D4239C|nr:uncharacterized protein LOC116346167 [Contarinia nasturtii]
MIKLHVTMNLLRKMLNAKCVVLMAFVICVVATVADAVFGKGKKPSSSDPDIIWGVFNATDINGNDIVQYTIRNIPKKKFDQALDIMINYYLTDEPISVAMGIINDKNVVKSYRKQWLKILKNGLSVACFKSGTDEIVGVQLLQIESKNSGYYGFDLFEKYNVTKFLIDDGMAVVSAYRGRKIGKQLLLAREPICAAHNLRVTSAIFTSTYSLAIAIDLGYELNKQIGYEDVKLYRKSYLPYIDGVTMVLMSKQY